MKGTLCEEYFYRPDQGHSSRKVTMKKKRKRKKRDYKAKTERQQLRTLGEKKKNLPIRNNPTRSPVRQNDQKQHPL